MHKRQFRISRPIQTAGVLGVHNSMEAIQINHLIDLADDYTLNFGLAKWLYLMNHAWQATHCYYRGLFAILANYATETSLLT